MPSRILFLHAHPDDAEILAGGTLAHLAARGHTVVIATMTAGDCGSVEYGPEETAAVRRAEAAAAAAMIGAQYHWIGFGDLAIFNDDPSRRRVTAMVRQFQADIVITSSPLDYHCDHEATSKLVTDACFGASAPNYWTRSFSEAPALPAIPHLYYADPVEGIDRDGNQIRPDFIVDVSETLDIKRSMLAAHASQRDWLRRQHGLDNFILSMEAWTQARGALGGVEYGEGFRRYRGHAFPQTPLLESLLDSLVRPVHP